MPVVVPETSTAGDPIRCRRPRKNQPISESDPNNSPQTPPSIIQSTRCKPTISSLLLSTFSPTAGENNTTPTKPSKKKSFTANSFRGLGCAAASPPQVSAAIRTSADWEAKEEERKKKQLKKKKKNKAPNQGLAVANSNPSSSAPIVVPDVCCGPGIGFTTDAASVDCFVSRRPVSGRERPSCSTRRMVDPEHFPFMDSDHYFGMRHSGLDVFGSRYHRHARHPSPEGLAEIMMLRSSLMMGGRSDGFDRYRELRLDVDNMSYEELLELGDKIGYVNTGLKEDEIVHCLRKTKPLDNLFSQFPTEMEWKCSICQEDYEEDDEVGKLECGHFYHIDCIKQWLVQKNACPICKTTAASQ